MKRSEFDTKKMKFYVLKIHFALLLHLSSGHKGTPFQGINSLLSEDQLESPFPFGTHEWINSEDVRAILIPDRELIKDGGNVKIKAELIGIGKSIF